MAQTSLMNDILFKIVFGSTANEPILRAFLNAILGLTGQERIVELTILNPTLDKEYLKDKGVILDVKSRDGLGRQYNIEVQVQAQTYYVERSLYYAARLFSEQLERGEEYRLLAKTISISIMDFVLFEDQAELHSVYRLYDVRQKRELTDLIEMHYLEMPKFIKDKPRHLLSPFEKWLHVLRFSDLYDSTASLPDELIHEEGINMAIEAMKTAMSDGEVREIIEMRKKAMRDLASSLSAAKHEGFNEGTSQAKLAMALKLKALGVEPATILEATGLHSDELE